MKHPTRCLICHRCDKRIVRDASGKGRMRGVVSQCLPAHRCVTTHSLQSQVRRVNKAGLSFLDCRLTLTLDVREESPINADMNVTNRNPSGGSMDITYFLMLSTAFYSPVCRILRNKHITQNSDADFSTRVCHRNSDCTLSLFPVLWLATVIP